MTLEPVRKSIFVQAAPQRTWEVFLAGSWWPRSHSVLASGSPQISVTVEPRVGGRWYETGEDGSQCDWGNVLACDPPRRLVLTWMLNGNFERDPDSITEVEVTFAEEDGGTLVTLEHRGFDKIATGEQLRKAVDSDHGWGTIIGGLAKALAPSRYFVCQLITPRPTFMQDMNEAEGAALGAHIGYWKKLMGEGRVPIFGPVGDPAGVWGLGVLKALNENEARQVAEADPAITAGVGFGYRVHPMLQAVVPA
jgi:uncharacterized protein YndB with AHSA1/START domain/uncharacterized protein YciI